MNATKKLRPALAALAIAVAAAASIAVAAPAQADPTDLDRGLPLPAAPSTVGNGPVQTGFVPSYIHSQLNPNVAPSGANDFKCKPKDGQRPVVLLHGTYQNAYNDWAALAPTLKKRGYCVFTPNIGRTDLLNRGGMMTILPAVHGVADIKRAAKQFNGFVDRVRKATGSEQVDVVTHSQGGLVARQWLKTEGGTDKKDPSKSKADKLIMISSPNNGTTLDGMGWISRKLDDVGLPMFAIGQWTYGQAPLQQAIDSPLIKKLNKGKRTFPGVTMTNLATRYDEVVTPYDTAFIHEPGVKNILLQNGCEQDTSDHLSITYSPRTISIVERALDPEDDAEPVCAPHAWLADF
ncbi:MAG: alpha/beta fold hydrolase [Gordonia sp. (in: high G+C Gram-positive bacteria)]